MINLAHEKSLKKCQTDEKGLPHSEDAPSR